MSALSANLAALAAASGFRRLGRGLGEAEDGFRSEVEEPVLEVA